MRIYDPEEILLSAEQTVLTESWLLFRWSRYYRTIPNRGRVTDCIRHLSFCRLSVPCLLLSQCQRWNS